MIGYVNAFYFYMLTALAALPLIMMVRMKKPSPHLHPPPETKKANLSPAKGVQKR
jgi:hypothetical protein